MITFSLLIIHILQTTCRYKRPKPSLTPPTSSHHSPAPPPSSPTLLQDNSTATVGKRSLAIKFPGKGDHSGATAHQVEKKDSAIRRLDPAIKPASLVADSLVANRSQPLSLSSLPGKVNKDSKKRLSPAETFEPWSGVREPVKKAPRTERDIDSGSYTSSSMAAKSAPPAGGGSTKSKSVYASSSRRDVYGANSVEKRGNVLARGVPGNATKKARENKPKTGSTDTAVSSISVGMKELALHSKSEKERKPLVSTVHSSASKSGIKSHSVSSQRSSLDSSNTTKQTVSAPSAGGRGRGRGSQGEQTTGSHKPGPASRQSSTGGTSGTVSKGRGYGGRVVRGSPSTQHRTTRDKN